MPWFWNVTLPSFVRCVLFVFCKQQCFSPSLQILVSSNGLTPSPIPSPTRRFRWLFLNSHIKCNLFCIIFTVRVGCSIMVKIKIQIMGYQGNNFYLFPLLKQYAKPWRAYCVEKIPLHVFCDHLNSKLKIV